MSYRVLSQEVLCHRTASLAHTKAMTQPYSKDQRECYSISIELYKKLLEEEEEQEEYGKPKKPTYSSVWCSDVHQTLLYVVFLFLLVGVTTKHCYTLVFLFFLVFQASLNVHPTASG